MCGKARRKRHARETVNRILADPSVEKGFQAVDAPITVAGYIGNWSERKTDQRLKTMKACKRKFGSLGVIESVERTEHSGPEDKKAIDIKVKFSKRKEKLFIEVKNSTDWRVDLLGLMEKMRDRERCLLVMPFDTNDELADKLIIGTIKWYYGLFNE
ncbi:MAG TPA: hypothetical protein VJ378_01305 [Candidatus Paceibacterota bacterium]|nr:hypothetical protein [Candidatus Paceibacterota bacterium]